jgi:Flp pilus assembly protein TadD
MRAFAALLAVMVGWAASPVATFAADETPARPLLDLARELAQQRAAPSGNSANDSGVREAEHALRQAHVPADAVCAASLGAARYAGLHGDLGAALREQGDVAGAARAFGRAQACRPRDANILASLGRVLFRARQFDAARSSFEAALAIEPRTVRFNRDLGEIDFVTQRWVDAIARFRYVAASEDNRTYAGYDQLMLWVAQSRAGLAKPDFVARTPGEGWPQPLLLFMRNQYTEAELAKPIKEGDEALASRAYTEDNSPIATDQRLAEALFYVGEMYWARGLPSVAREYFTAIVNIKLNDAKVHELALAEIANLRKEEK